MVRMNEQYNGVGAKPPPADHLRLVQKFYATAFSKLEGAASKGGAE